MTLSVIIITKNEAHNIVACLNSTSFADQWIVVDSGSTDGTAELAQQAGAMVVHRPDWQGFGIQKNRALDFATADWVLSIDADERVTPALANEIQKAMASASSDGFDIRTVTAFYGRPVRFSEYYANTQSIRLFKRSCGRFTDALVHENIVLNSTRRSTLKHPLQHYSYEDPDTYLRKVNQYASLSAQMLFDRGKRARFGAAVGHALAAFFKSYVIKFGFLDGQAGVMIALLLAETTYHKYFKLMLLSEADQRKHTRQK
jgi:glycosyltransferase involved in cell wall biosynthesis